MQLLMKSGGVWQPQSFKNYATETDLEDILYASPDLVPGGAGATAIRQLVLPGGSRVDLCLVDDAATITLVECKLAKNYGARREVIGQVLSYASAIRGMSYQDFNAACEKRLHKSLPEAILDDGSVQDLDLGTFIGDFIEKMECALRRGAFRLVVAVDEIGDELERIVSYLNSHLPDDIPVIALQLGYLKIQDAELLIPYAYGAEAAVAKAKAPGSTRTSQEQVDAAVGQLPHATQDFLLQLLNHASKFATFKGGAGGRPSAGYYYLIHGSRKSLWSVWMDEQDAEIAVNLYAVKSASPPDAEAALAVLRTSPPMSILLGPNDQEVLERHVKRFSVHGLISDGVPASLLLDAFNAALGQGTG